MHGNVSEFVWNSTKYTSEEKSDPIGSNISSKNTGFAESPIRGGSANEWYCGEPNNCRSAWKDKITSKNSYIGIRVVRNK
jgi:formylglycine-generating enzyme required for sulfatase activity